MNRDDGDVPVPYEFSAYARGLDQTKVFDDEGNKMELEASDDAGHPANEGWQMFQHKGQKIWARRDANAPMLKLK